MHLTLNQSTEITSQVFSFDISKPKKLESSQKSKSYSAITPDMYSRHFTRSQTSKSAVLRTPPTPNSAVSRIPTTPTSKFPRKIQTPKSASRIQIKKSTIWHNPEKLDRFNMRKKIKENSPPEDPNLAINYSDQGIKILNYQFLDSKTHYSNRFINFHHFE